MQNWSLYLNYPVLHLIRQGCDLKGRTTGLKPKHYMVEGGFRSWGGGELPSNSKMGILF